jgi:uroporphyrinogen-III synthase
VWLDSGELGLIGRPFNLAQGGPEHGRTGGPKIASIGPATSATLREIGLVLEVTEYGIILSLNIVCC